VDTFDASRWADEKFAKEYRAEADAYLPDRARHLAMIRSFYRHFVAGAGDRRRVLDLGCGDGIITAALLDLDSTIEATLVDGAESMLEAARQRLKPYELKTIQSGFESLDRAGLRAGSFDLVISSLAIHHLTLPDKHRLFSRIHGWLRDNGRLLVLDAVLGASPETEEWYVRLWEQWVEGLSDETQRNVAMPVPRRYKENTDNKPDTLLAQLDALREIGYRDADCYYKFGLFAMFGGRKPSRSAE
jgi:tRNA (cmo5U34)-methyltransferase